MHRLARPVDGSFVKFSESHPAEPFTVAVRELSWIHKCRSISTTPMPRTIHHAPSAVRNAFILGL